jgi:Ras GTPase-activating-like protein IQGAP2/3
MPEKGLPNGSCKVTPHRKSGQPIDALFLLLATDVEDSETHFGMDALDDHARTHKPTVYISPYELCHLHYMLEQHMDDMAPKKQGTLYDIINDLGPSPFKPGVQLPKTTWCLKLSNRQDDLPQGSSAQLQQLVTDTKRLVVYIIKIQSGRHLQDIFDQPLEDHHEAQWVQLKQTEFLPQEDSNYHESLSQKRRFLKLGNTPLDINE